MAYDQKEWFRRIAERTDMSTGLVHLTRESEYDSVGAVLFKILSERKLVGSTTISGFICGDTRAVCFQDAPLSSICQNTFYEQKKREVDENYKLRYRAIGLMFPKPYVFRKSGRPAIYDKTDQAKSYLPESEWWRIVNLNYDDPNNFIDWTHEREWRIPGDFHFELSETTLLAIRNSTVKELAEKFKESEELDLISELKGIVTLENILY